MHKKFRAVLVWMSGLFAPHAMFLPRTLKIGGSSAHRSLIHYADRQVRLKTGDDPASANRKIFTDNETLGPLHRYPEWDRVPFMLTGSHYKSGTIMIGDVLQAMVRTLAQHDPAGRAKTHHYNYGYGEEYGIGNSPTSLHYFYPDAYTYTNLTNHASAFRFVHIIRDPIEMTISAYWYIRRQQEEGEGDRGWGPSQIITDSEMAQLLSTGVGAGLEIVAHGMLTKTVQAMQGFYNASRGDTRVLTIGLENFEADFNKTVQCTHRFHMEPVMPQVCKSLADALLEGAQIADARRRKATLKSDHFNSDENKQLSRNLIATSTSPVWEKLREARRELGYLGSEIDDSFWLPMPSQCSFN